jgi:hypothetical protein
MFVKVSCFYGSLSFSVDGARLAYPLRGEGRVAGSALGRESRGNGFASDSFRSTSTRDGLQELDTGTAGERTCHGEIKLIRVKMHKTSTKGAYDSFRRPSRKGGYSLNKETEGK